MDLFTERIDVPFALDIIDADYHGPAVSAFQTSLTAGEGSAGVVDSDGITQTLTILDGREAVGCLLAILTPPASTDGDEEDHYERLLPRRCSLTLAASGEILTVDDDFCLRLGWTRDEIVGQSSLRIIHPDDQDRAVSYWGKLLVRAGSQSRDRKRFATKTGEWVWVETTDTNHLADPEHRHIFCDVFDITEEMAAHTALEEREQLLLRLTESLPSGVAHLGANGEIYLTNGRWSSITTLDEDAPLSALGNVVLQPPDILNIIDETRRARVDCDVEVTLRPPGSTAERYGLLRLRPLQRGDKETADLILVIDDVTAERHQRDLLVEAAERDRMTGVLNRATFQARTTELIDQRQPLTLLFCDLDRLKSINDQHGHVAGDEAIERTAAALAAEVRRDDLVGRVGGDEFVVALRTDHAGEINDVVDRISKRLAETSPDIDFELSISIGVATLRPGEDLDAVLQRADHDMYEKKAARR